jgi:GMP synthase-like glutamine amidotransferase
VKFLVLQHISVEHPGAWRDTLRAGGVDWDTVELDAGEAMPPLGGYDALISMGGPMDVFDTAEHAWLKTEKAAIREAVRERGMAFLGVCLGHQLLADALGGTVGRMAAPEVGLMEVALTAAGMADPLFAGLDKSFTCLQWHSCEIQMPPAGCEILAASPACAAQAVRVGRRAYGLQFHIEMTARTVTEWAEIPAYERSLEAALGPSALARLDSGISAGLPKFNAMARRLCENFISLVR